MSFIEKIIDGLIADIGSMKDEAYLSESDFQFEFASKAKALGAERVIIEFPFMFGRNVTRKHVDVYFEHDGTEYYVELKYKTTSFEGVTRYGVEAELSLANQYAENDSMFAFRKDVERMEKLLASSDGRTVEAYCVFLTNYHGFWNAHKTGNGIEKVQLNEEIKPGKLQYGTDRSCDIANTYKLVWKDFKKLGDNQMMRYLIVECKPGCKE